jgi:hypothetical protein
LTTWERFIPKSEHGSQTRKPKYLYSGEYRAKLYTIPRSWE